MYTSGNQVYGGYSHQNKGLLSSPKKGKKRTVQGNKFLLALHRLTVVMALGLAPCWRRTLMMWVWPCWAAWWRGVYPFCCPRQLW